LPSFSAPARRLARFGVGLRPRIFAALALVSVVTLGVAAVTLLPTLQLNLRNKLESLAKGAVNAARPVFADLPLHHGLPPAARVDHLEKNYLRPYRVLLWATQPTLHTISDTDHNVPFLATTPVVRSALRGRMLTPTGTVGTEYVVASKYNDAGHNYVLEVIKSLDYVGEANGVVRDAFLEAALIGLAVALLLAAILSSRLLSRLRLLRDATRDLDHPGLANLAVGDDTVADEIGQLARAFAAMRERLTAHEDSRRSFVATASHELRTPLASLDGMLELIADDLSSDPIDIDDARERVARAQEQSRRLAGLASDLLDLSRLDAALELRAEPVELGEIARAVSAEFERVAADRAVTLAIKAPAKQCWSEADPGSVARIVRILLDNALRVAPRDSTVTIKIGTPEDAAAIEVADEGPGVPLSERGKIFERFQRGSARGSDGGFGLGLAIGRELANRMGGSLVLVGGPPGARFRLRLPLAAAGAPSE
jgi:signal transduction histidine kinase